MPSTRTIPIPPATTVHLLQAQDYQFKVKAGTRCTICFGKNHLFGNHVSGQSYPLNGGAPLGPFTAPSANTSVTYNVVPGAEQCRVVPPTGTVRVIHVGSGAVTKKHKSKKSPKSRKTRSRQTRARTTRTKKTRKGSKARNRKIPTHRAKAKKK
jgi:hypothetical protein